MKNVINEEEFHKLLEDYSALPEFSGLKCVSANTLSLFGDRPIHIAATRGNIDEIKLILSRGVDINCKGEHGYTALHDAVEQGHRDAVIYLLSQGADPKIHNDSGISPVGLAKLLNMHEISYIFRGNF